MHYQPAFENIETEKETDFCYILKVLGKTINWCFSMEKYLYM